MRIVSYVVVLVPGGGLVDGDHDDIYNDENDDDDDHAMITLQMEQMGFWWGVHWTNQFLGDGVTRDREQGPGRETGREKGKFLERKIQQFIQIGIK